MEEIGAIEGTVHHPWLLDFDKQDAQDFLEFFGHDRGMNAEDGIDVLDMFKILVETQLFQDLAHLLVIDFRQVRDALFLDPFANGFHHIHWNLRRLLGQKLRQNLAKMVQTNVRIVRDFVRRLLVTRLLIVNNVRREMSTLSVIANENTFVVLGDEFSDTAFFANVGGDEVVL